MINKTTHKKEIFNYDIDVDKFWSFVDIRSLDECWEWKGGRSTGGYGSFSIRDTPDGYERTGRTYTQILAHRVACALTKPLEKHDYVMHKCDNRACCNPKHFQVGTALDNLLDAMEKGRQWGQATKEVAQCFGCMPLCDPPKDGDAA